MSKVFMDGNGKRYLAEEKKSEGDCECPFVSDAALAVLRQATVALDDVDLAAAMQIGRDYPEVLGTLELTEEAPPNA